MENADVVVGIVVVVLVRNAENVFFQLSLSPSTSTSLKISNWTHAYTHTHSLTHKPWTFGIEFVWRGGKCRDRILQPISHNKPSWLSKFCWLLFLFEFLDGIWFCLRNIQTKCLARNIHIFRSTLYQLQWCDDGGKRQAVPIDWISVKYFIRIT